MAGRGLGGQDCEETSGSGGRTYAGEPHVRLCSKCKKSGYNVRTCQVVCETSEESDSE